MNEYTEKIYLNTEHDAQWSEVRNHLYELVNDPDFHDPDVYKHVADTIDNVLSKMDYPLELVPSNELFPAMVQVLHGLYSIKKYADGADYKENVKFLKRLLDSI